MSSEAEDPLDLKMKKLYFTGGKNYVNRNWCSYRSSYRYCALAEATAIYGFVIGLLIIIMLG